MAVRSSVSFGKFGTRGIRAGLSILLASTCLSGIALAQENPAVDEREQARQNGLDVIVVTAQRRSESVQDVPAAITALDGEAMEQRGISDVESLQFAVPSLTLGRSLGVTQIAIRGVGRSVGSPGVAINIDGVYQPRNTPMIIGESDLERVEVLRGPQGTLYGRNANGGAVNFVTAAPEGELGGYVVLGEAEYGEHHVQSVLNLPVNDRVRTRLALDYVSREKGFVENVAGGEDLDTVETLSGRLRVAADITDDLSLDLNFNVFTGSGAGDYYVLTSEPSAAGIALNPYIVTANIPLQDFKTSALGPTGSQRDFQSLSATFDWRLPFGVDLKSITAYQRMDNKWDMDRDGVDLSVVDAHADEHSETFSQEINASSSIGPVDWVSGLYYFDDTYSQTTFYAFPLGFTPLPVNSFLVQHMPQYDSKAYAVFGDATWNLSDELRLIGGLRYSEDKADVVHRNFVGNLVTGVPFLDTCRLQTDDLKWDSTTYRVGGQYDLADDQQVFLTTSTGFKAGGVNFSGCNNAFNPENITSYEGGYKGVLFSDTLMLNASAFLYDYTDFQLTQVVGIAGRVTNAASATVKGIEVEAQWVPNDNWSVNGSLALLEATFGSFTNTDSLNASLGPQDLKGRYLANSPKISGNIGVAYKTDPSDHGQFTLRADVSARSKIYFREFNNELEAQPAYAIVNANVIWDSPDELYTVRLFANNLFNEGYYVAMLAVDGFGARAGSFGTPRQAGFELKARF